MITGMEKVTEPKCFAMEAKKRREYPRREGYTEEWRKGAPKGDRTETIPFKGRCMFCDRRCHKIAECEELKKLKRGRWQVKAAEEESESKSSSIYLCLEIGSASKQSLS